MSLTDRIQKLEYLKILLGELQAQYVVHEVDSYIYRISPRDGFLSSKKIAVVALTHGDEVVGLDILVHMLLHMLEGRLVLGGEVYMVLANVPAFLKNQRYIDVDLNRVYAADGASGVEVERVKAIQSVVDACDYVVDLHQSIEETLHPFFILPYSEQSYRWVRAVAPDIPLIAKYGIETATTLSSYAFLNGKMSVTFEVGGYGVDLYQLTLGLTVVKDFLRFAWDPMLELSISAHRSLAPIYEIKHFQPYTKGQVHFDKIFVNFELIDRGQVIAYLNDQPICAPMSGQILLYPRKWFEVDSTTQPDGLFVLLQAKQAQQVVH